MRRKGMGILGAFDYISYIYKNKMYSKNYFIIKFVYVSIKIDYAFYINIIYLQKFILVLIFKFNK